MIWVCAMHQVRAWIEMPESDLYQRGSVHLVSNVPQIVGTLGKHIV